MIIADSPSPNFGPRAEGKKIKYIVLHYTGTRSAFDAVEILQDPARQVSAHYMVDEDGSILRLVPEEMRAWHAGKSSWEGETDINSCSIGIEIHNLGHDHGYRPFPEAQIRAVIALCRDIILRHGILPQHVIAHSDIAPERKKDPGELFPWAMLASSGVGLWPQVNDGDEAEAMDIVSDHEKIKSLLTYFGYDARADFKTLIAAFQRHFEPETFADEDKVGVVTIAAAARIVALHRQKLALRPKTKSA